MVVWARSSLSVRKFNEMTVKPTPTPTPGKPNRSYDPTQPHDQCCCNHDSQYGVSGAKNEVTRSALRRYWRLRRHGSKGSDVGYDDTTYKSESVTADRNWCLVYMMKESQSFPDWLTSLEAGSSGDVLPTLLDSAPSL